MSRPQAITATNLTQEQVQTLILENPTRPSILQANDQFLPPSIPLYLPDPERNKSKDDFYLLATYSDDGKQEPADSPVKLPLPLDTFMRPPPIPNPESIPINFNVNQDEKERPSYSYNDRYDYYFPVKVVYDDQQKYASQEVQLMEMQPPTIQNDEPNYYAIKPKKVPKKYQPNKKDLNHSKSNGRDDGLVPIDNDGLVLDSEHTPFVTSHPVERFAPAPAPSYRDLSDDDLNTGEYIPKYQQDQNTEAISLPENSRSTTITTAAAAAASNKRVQQLKSGEPNAIQYNPFNYSNDQVDDYEKIGMRKTDDDDGDDVNKRVEFQMHGFNGPNSYKFGYDTGSG